MATINLNSPEAEGILKQSHVILENQHFVYISGDHGSGWIDKDVIYPHTATVRQLVSLLAPECVKYHPDIICGPATGGLVLSQWLAHELNVLSVFTEHGIVSGGGEMRGTFTLKRHYDKLVAGKRVLVVDDIVNTGHSIKQTAAAVRDAGGIVVAAAAICSRGNTDAIGIGVEDFVFLSQIDIPAWPQSDCDLCKTNVPVNTDFAHGADFVAAQKQPVA